MAVRIRMKQMGRRHRRFYRICAVDGRKPRDGRVLEELGTYDPMIADVEARTILNAERINYWLSVGAQPSDKVGVLIKKYGAEGTHLPQQKEALEQLAQARRRPEPIVPVAVVAEAAPAQEAPVEAEAAPAQEAPVEAEAVEAEPVSDAQENTE